METRRLLLFLVLSFGFVLIWTNFVAPPPRPQPAAEVPAATDGDDDLPSVQDSAEADSEVDSAESDAVSETVTADDTSSTTADAAPAQFESREIVLG